MDEGGRQVGIGLAVAGIFVGVGLMASTFLAAYLEHSYYAVHKPEEKKEAAAPTVSTGTNTDDVSGRTR